MLYAVVRRSAIGSTPDRILAIRRDRADAMGKARELAVAKSEESNALVHSGSGTSFAVIQAADGYWLEMVPSPPGIQAIVSYLVEPVEDHD